MRYFIPSGPLALKVFAFIFLLGFWLAHSNAAIAQHGGAGHVATAGGARPVISRPVAPPRPVLARPLTPRSLPPQRFTPLRIAPPFAGAAVPGLHASVPVRPIRPIPIGPRPPIFFGHSFFPRRPFGLGFAYGFSTLWPGNCAPIWIWTYTSCTSPFYNPADSLGIAPSYGLGAGVLPGFAEQLEPLPYPFYVYGDEGSEFVQLFLKDGTIYTVRDYWLTGHMLHFTTLEENGTKLVEHAIDLDQLDLQRTVDVNTGRGFRFVLRNEPIDQWLRDHPDTNAPSQP